MSLPFKKTKGGMYYIVPGSYWNKCKIVIQGDIIDEETGERAPDEWEEGEDINTLREFGGVFVNDEFMFLFEKYTGILFLGGGYGTGKTTSVVTQQLIKSQELPYHRCYYGREVLEDTKKKLHKTFITEIYNNGWKDLFTFYETPTGVKTITCKANGNIIEPFGCDNTESLKGLDKATDIFVDEVNQISFESMGMLLTRLRGAGDNKQFIGTFNNCDVYDGEWLKDLIYGDMKSDDKKIQNILNALKRLKVTKHQSTYLHNHFQNPVKFFNQLILQAAGDESLAQDYADGNWGISLTQKPFYSQYSESKHVYRDLINGYEDYNPNLPLHVSFDENVNPYLPAIICQIVGKRVYVIDEVAFENPLNKLNFVCEEICRRYEGHKSGLFIYGDATADKENILLEEGKNMFTVAMSGLAVFDPTLRQRESNPNVKMRGMFMNLIFGRELEEISICIFPKCAKTKEDLKMTQDSPDGSGKKDKKTSMVGGKRGVQKYGHMSDCLDYIVCDVFEEEYRKFQAGDVVLPISGGGRIVRNTIYDDIKIYTEKESEKKAQKSLQDRIQEEQLRIAHLNRLRPRRNGW